MHSRYFDIQKAQEHLENIERELTILKDLIAPAVEEHESEDKTRIQELRKQLIAEGLDEELVQLVGTVPLRSNSYKEEIRYYFESREYSFRNQKSKIGNRKSP